MKIKKSPPDGSCFFHSIAAQCTLSAAYLRKCCAALIEQNANKMYNGLELKHWIQYETGFSVKEYSKRMKSGAWGGALETQILADWLQRPIGIYKLKEKSAILITEIKPSLKPGKPIYLLYNGHSHYDALL